MNKIELEEFVDTLLEDEKEGFRPGIESFAMRTDRIKVQVADFMQQFQSQFTQGYATILNSLARQEIPPQIREETLAIFDDPVAFQKALETGSEIYDLLGFSQDNLKKFFTVGLELVKKEEYAQAKDVFYFLVTFASNTPAFWLGLGFCQSKLNHLEEAESAFRQVIDLDPINADAYLAYLNLLIKSNSIKEALHLCDEGLIKAHSFNDALASEFILLLTEAKKYITDHFSQ